MGNNPQEGKALMRIHPQVNTHTWELVMQKVMARFINDESGATAIEYGLLAALIGVGIVGGATILGNNLNASFTSIGEKVETSATAV